MLKKALPALLLIPFGLASCTFSTTANTGTTNQQVSFSCDRDQLNGQTVPATIAKTNGKTFVIIRWNPKNRYFGSDWTPQRRCEEVAQRFQKIHDRDGIKFITADTASWIGQGNINVVCAVQQENTSCREDDLLFTLESKDDPNEVLTDLIALRERPKENKPLTRGSNFDGGRRIYFDLSKELGAEKSPANQERSF